MRRPVFCGAFVAERLYTVGNASISVVMKDAVFPGGHKHVRYRRQGLHRLVRCSSAVELYREMPPGRTTKLHKMLLRPLRSNQEKQVPDSQPKIKQRLNIYDSIFSGPPTLGSERSLACYRFFLQYVVSSHPRLSSSLADESLAAGAEEEQEPCPRSPCVSCAAAGVATGAQAVEKKKGTSQPLRCEAQEKRDLVLEGMLRWAVDVHFRRCSGLLQASLSRAVCDGVRQALDAAELSPGGGRTPLGGRRTPPPPCFPLGCRLLLSFVGGLAGDGGARAAAFLQERCGAELRLFLARAHRRFGPPSSSASGGGHNASAGTLLAKKQRRRRRPELPVLNAYVGHLCLCRHVSDSLAGRHLVWLARQGLAVLRLLDRQDDVASGATTNTDPTRPEWEEIATELLAALTYALALLLTRPKRDVGCASLTTAVPENAGNVLEIVFDSDARPLSGVPIRLAEAAIGVLKEAGHLQLVRSEELLRPPPPPPTPVRPGGGSRGRGASTFAGHLAPPGGSGGGGGDDDDARVVVREKKTAAPVATAGGGGGGGSGVSDAYSFASDGIEFVRASVAFGSSWSLAAAGLDPQLPVLRARKRGLAEVIDGDDQDDDDSDAGSENGGSMAGNGWGWVPDEVTLRVFSFMTPKRVCRLACVDRAWRELLAVSRVWRPFFEARWPVMDLDSKEDLEGVSSRLLLEGQVRGGGEMKKKPRRKRVKTGVVRWRIPVVGQVCLFYRFGDGHLPGIYT